MKIGIDIDGVIACVLAPWLIRCNEVLAERGQRCDWTEADLQQWEFWVTIGLPEPEAWELFTPDIYMAVEPYPGALNAVKAIAAKGHDIVYITSCVSEREWAAKFAWLEDHGFTVAAGDAGTTAVGVGAWAHHKTKADVAVALDVSWLIDDSVSNCASWPGYALLQTRPANRNLASTTKRIKDLAEVPGLLTYMAKGLTEWDRLHASDTGPMGTEARANLASSLPTDSAERKTMPLCTGLLDYFPAALAEVAKVSYAATQQHHPGEPMHWARGVSMDHPDCAMRHIAERGTRDTDGQRHSAKAAWRVLAILQEECEAEGAPMSRASRVK